MGYLPYPVKVLASQGSWELARSVCQILEKKLPSDLLPKDGFLFQEHQLSVFANENMEVQGPNVRGHRVVIIHTQTPPVSDGLIELMAILDAVSGASAGDILLVFPYMPYCRSDRKDKPRISVMGPRLAKIFNVAFDVRSILLVDAHSPSLKHYFNPAADEISAVYLLIDYLERNFFVDHSKKDCVIVFPDAGAAKRFEEVAKILKLPVVYISKKRLDNEGKDINVEAVVGNVKGKICLIFDDEILSGGTAIGNAKRLLAKGAKLVIMAAVHPVFLSKNMSVAVLMEKLGKSPIERFIVTDTIPVREKIPPDSAKFSIVPVAGLLAEAISRAVQNESLTALYDPKSVSFYR